MGWIWCVRCEKSRSHFVARTFALIALVHPFLHRVSCSYEAIPNAPKYYETYRNITLGSNWLDWDCPLQKIPTSLRGTNFCINCTSSPRSAPSFMQLRNNPKCTKILQRSNGWIGCVRCKKSRRHLVARTLALIAPIHPILHRVSCSYEMIPNAPKHYETHQNISLGSNGVDQVRLLGKITT